MGTWGHKAFENDDASDWIWELEEAESPAAFLEETLRLIHDQDTGDYLEAPECANAIAAAEIICLVLGKSHEKIEEDAEAIVASLKPDDVQPIRELARKTSERIMKESELQELWDEAEDISWREWMQGQIKRLG